jgi:hypothetical protein
MVKRRSRRRGGGAAPGAPPKDGQNEPLHRGRVQAQGGGIEKSEPWAGLASPTEDQLLEMVNRLEQNLSVTERSEREVPLKEVRKYIRDAAKKGGVDAPVSKTFSNPKSRHIRIDLQVFTGRAATPTGGK